MPTESTSLLEYHVLLALAGEPLYGYAIKDAIAEESSGGVTPRAGSLYRVVARLITRGWVAETEPAEEAEPHPGLARRYYGLTPEGREALRVETGRLRAAAALAERRLGAADGAR
jgi:DNA-binding PadR family transcriptional regulator